MSEKNILEENIADSKITGSTIAESTIKESDITEESMTVEQAVDYVYASYLKAEPYLDYAAPDCEKRNPGLSKAIIAKRAGIPTALVTGSKGKGSVAKMIAEIMGVHRKTGLMTSPHIVTFHERFQIQGEPVNDEALSLAVMRVKPEFDAVERKLSCKEYISPMGIQAAVALELFRAADVEFQVLECGKGAAFDDVNNVPHKYAVINRIFLEHTRELGSTLSEIAENKAAIMTGQAVSGQAVMEQGRDSGAEEDKSAGQIIFTAEQAPEVMAVLERHAREKGCELLRYGKDFWCENIVYTEQGMHFDVVTGRNRYEGIQIPLLGTYQAKNCALALALCEEELGSLQIEAVKAALKWLEWPGRLEILSSNPLVLLDACINRSSCENVLEALEQLKLEKINVIIGIPMDKDYLGVAQAMQSVAHRIILTKSSNPHYRFGQEQVQVLKTAGLEADWAENIAEALKRARFKQPDVPVCILGTTSLISDVKKLAKTPVAL
ncbi:MAG: bifunctional protein FolC [Lachnospiraceae bacterium]|nr:bifunctional protein FolC [Lachnospiraceae bacterium]